MGWEADRPGSLGGRCGQAAGSGEWRRDVSGAVVDVEKPLPANPKGMAQLAGALEAIREPSSSFPVGVQPDTNRVKSGQVYVFPSNPFQVEKLTIELDDPAETVVYLDATTGERFAWTVGKDGKFRQSEDGRAMRGYWADPMTFVFETFDVGRLTYALHFDGDRVVLDSPDLSINAEGKIESP